MTTCVYCGQSTNRPQRDHIPPRLLFRKPRPSNLITVPCCDSCHTTTSRDDEYFRNVLALYWKTVDHPDVAGHHGAMDKAMRAFERPKAEVFARSFLAGVQPLPEWFRDRYPGDVGGAFFVDINRLLQVVGRTIRGLYFHETGTVFPPTGQIRMACNDEFGTNKLWPTIAPLAARLRRLPARAIGQKTFVYRCKIVQERPWVSGWLLSFYADAIQFFGATRPPESAENAGTPPATRATAD